MSTARLRLGICQQRVYRPQSFELWQQHCTARVAEAVDQGARLLLFPEYGSLELSALLPEPVRADLRASLLALQALRAAFLDTFVRLSETFAVNILAPSFPWRRDDDGKVVNRAWLLRPDRPPTWQDKRTMTRFEDESWGVSAADELTVFDIEGVRVGVQICYDIEFPQASRLLYEAGAELLLVPSCTDSWHGYHRVRTGCRARALEQHLLVAQAPLAGRATWSPAIDVNVGRAALYAPSDRGFPASGTVARSCSPTGSEWLVVDADLQALRALRADPAVFNPRDWRSQQRPAAGPARYG